MSEYRILLSRKKEWDMQCVCSNTLLAYSLQYIVIRNLLSRKIIRKLQKQGSCHAISMSPKGRQIVTGWEGDVCLWDVCTGSKLRQIQPKFALKISHSPYGQYIGIMLHKERRIELWDNHLQQILNIFLVDCGISDLKFSPCGTMLAASSNNTYDNDYLYVWAINGQKSNKYKVPPTKYYCIPQLAYSPNGLEIALINGENLIIWDIYPNYNLIQRQIQKNSGSKLCYLQSGKILIVGSANPASTDIKTRQSCPWSCLGYSPKYRYLITSQSQKQIRIIKSVDQDLINYRVQNTNETCIFLQAEKLNICTLILKQKPGSGNDGSCILL